MMCAQTFLKTPLCKLWRVDAFLVSGFKFQVSSFWFQVHQLVRARTREFSF